MHLCLQIVRGAAKNCFAKLRRGTQYRPGVLTRRYAKLPPRPPGTGQGITPSDVTTRMVRLAGLMFDRINLEQVRKHLCVKVKSDVTHMHGETGRPHVRPYQLGAGAQTFVCELKQ